MDELKRLYRLALPARISALESAQATGGPEGDAAIRRIAHTLRGSGGTYGFPRVTEAAVALEEASPDERDERLAHLLSVLREIVRKS